MRTVKRYLNYLKIDCVCVVVYVYVLVLIVKKYTITLLRALTWRLQGTTTKNIT